MIVFCHKLTVAFNDGPIKDDMTMIIKTILNFKKKPFYSVSNTGGSYEKILVVKPMTFWPQLFKRWIALLADKYWGNYYCTIHWIELYLALVV